MIEIFPTDPEIVVDPGLAADGSKIKVLSFYLENRTIRVAAAIAPEAAQTIAAALTAPHPREG